jgi:glycosyltransferase involved in cell wall biosynthesis
MDAHLVLFCGMDRPEKRLDLARAAVARLADQDPPVQLVIASGKAHEEIPHYMNACDVLVLTSDYEGSPMVIKEAMACNLPIVSVDVGDVRQVIGETKGCYLAERSVDDIAAKLRLALAYGQRTDGRSRIAHLDNRLIAQRLIGLYEDVLRRKKT